MFFILSKVLDFVISPIIWIVVLFLMALFLKQPKSRRKALVTGIFMLLFFTNPYIANVAMHAFEVRSFPIFWKLKSTVLLFW